MRVSRPPVVSEVVMKSHFPLDRHLVGRHAPLEEVRQFLHVLKFHEAKRILRTKYRSDAERFQTAIGNVLQVFPHVGGGKTTDTETQDIVREGHFALHCVFQHGGYALLDIFVKQSRLLLSGRPNHFQSKPNMRALVAEDPVGTGREPMQQAAGTKKVDIGKCCEKEQALNATGKADEIQQKAAAVLYGLDFCQAIDGVDPAETKFRLFSNGSNVLDRVECLLPLFWVRDVGVKERQIEVHVLRFFKKLAG